MGNTHSGFNLTRTSGALDSFVADLGGDIVYEKRCLHPCSLNFPATKQIPPVLAQLDF